MQTNDDCSSGGSIGSSSSPHADAFSAYDGALALRHAGEVAHVRALAELGRSALREARQGGVRGMASDMELRSVAAEAAGMARSTDRRVQREIDHAMTVVDDYPAVFAAWVERRIERGHVDAVVRVGAGVPLELRGEFERAAITACERDVPSRVQGALEVLAAQVHPQSFTERHRAAAAERCVRVFPGPDGMSNLVATLPTVIAAGMFDRLTQMGQALKDAGADAGAAAVDDGAAAVDDGAAAADAAAEPDLRTMDQRRADILGDLVLAGAPVVDPTTGIDRSGGLGAIRARVQVAITAESLTGSDQHPAEVVGAGLIDADTARRLAGQTREWDRLFVDPITRTPVEVDTYRPTAAMAKLLRARDQHCRFPGCRLAAIRCEIDHTRDYALGGHTHLGNLAHLCQRHHSMKQFTSWQVRQVGGGVLEWTSPRGRIYREDVPIPAVCFTPSTADPPPGPRRSVHDQKTGDPPPF
ncbi:HNH endonuclease signature motif containing protein [Microbacterium sp. cf332]|uniref:HNH endonuclease signature motif containing protein n=1 Tax=Microbacterium sp. cf332 TaxID=1761804 RepID=UPI000B80694E|nr:HNH endonuclease signature motif containing protein [Microbacterium sp. cf332]